MVEDQVFHIEAIRVQTNERADSAESVDIYQPRSRISSGEYTKSESPCSCSTSSTVQTSRMITPSSLGSISKTAFYLFFTAKVIVLLITSVLLPI